MTITDHDHAAQALNYVSAAERDASRDKQWSADLIARIAQTHATLAVAEELRAMREQRGRPLTDSEQGDGVSRDDTGGQQP